MENPFAVLKKAIAEGVRSGGKQVHIKHNGEICLNGEENVKRQYQMVRMTMYRKPKKQKKLGPPRRKPEIRVLHNYRPLCDDSIMNYRSPLDSEQQQ